MRLTIIKADHMVYVDGVPLPVECSDLPEDFHALQWDGSDGWIEFVQGASGPAKLNEAISDIAPYQPYIDAWVEEMERREDMPPPAA